MRKKISLILVVAFLGAFYAFKDPYFEISKNLEIFTTIYHRLNTNYVDELEPGSLMDAAINAMLKKLDPYTNYIPESKVEEYRIQTQGSYGGVGASIIKIDDYVVVSEVYESAPAQLAGIIPGDKLLKIDKNDVKGKSTKEIGEVLKGQAGTEVIVEVERINEPKPVEFKITREEVSIPSIPYTGVLEDKIGYIRLRSFTKNCSREVGEAFNKLKTDDKIESLVLDLRGNPGGLLGEAINMCNLFIPSGELVVSTKGKLKENDKSYKTTKKPLDQEIPIVVLVDQGSASASEIVSGTFQDIERAVVVGNQTFGKGLVQQTMPMPYNAQVKITTAKYYTPSGRCIQAIDYSSRNADGSVGKIADSLRTEFTTRAGRKVFDGGGVKPDVEMEIKEYPSIIVSLIKDHHLFNFANMFAAQNTDIADPLDFTITDDVYADFVKYLKDQDYTYETHTEQAFELLEETAEGEKYLDALKEQMEVLKKEYFAHKENDIEKYKSEIKEFLLDEIVLRYYYRKGQLQVALKNDPATKKAIALLKNDAEYKALLKP